MNPQVEKFIKMPIYQRMLIIALIDALICAVAGWFFIYPNYINYSLLIDKNNKVGEQLQKDQRIAADLPKFKEEYEKMKGQLDQALTELPNDREIPLLLTSIATLAKDNGLDVLQFKPGSEVVKGFYAEVPVSLKLQGSYHQVGKFFYDIGALPRIVNLGAVNMGGAKNDKGQLSLSVDCLAVTFRFLEGQQQPAKGPSKK